MYDFSHFKRQGQETVEWLKREFSGIRTGRATPAILDNVSVESYGTLMKVKEISSIVGVDAKSLRVAPWDMSQAKNIEKGIVAADLGLSVAVDDKGLRVIFPELSAERRQALLKVAKGKLEEGRVAIRGEREKVKEDIEKKEKAGGMGEDDKWRFMEDLKKLVDGFNKDLEAAYERKEKEIQE
ncbi:MAG TPA: ribosome-recycling factor [Candidatus Paceibacterota bacterium]